MRRNPSAFCTFTIACAPGLLKKNMSPPNDSNGYANRARLKTLGSGYTLFVRITKIILPLAALIIIGVVMTRLSTPVLQPSDTLPTADKTTPGQIEVIQAQYEGVDDQGRVYTLIADRASRAPSGENNVLLENPKADLLMEDGSWLAMQARSGGYSIDTAFLSLKDSVSVFHDTGYEIGLTALDIDLKKKTAYSANPLHIQGPQAQMDAATLDIKDSGNTVVFGGPVRILLYALTPDKKDGAG